MNMFCELRANTHLALLSLLLAGLLALFLRDAASLWAVNQWSRDFVQSPAAVALAAPPPTHRRAPIWLAQRALDSQNYTAVKNLLYPLLQTENIFALSIWGNALYQQDNYAEAVNIWGATNDQASLETLVQSSIEQDEDALTDLGYQALLELNPERYGWLYAEFLAHTMGDFTAAERLLLSLLDSSPAQAKEWSYRLGNIYEEQHKWADAEAAYAIALSFEPDDYWALVRMGIVVYNRGNQFEQSTTWITKAIDIDPNQGDAYYYYAYVLSREGRYTEVEQWVSKAIAINPDAHWWYILRSGAARDAGNLDLALSVSLEATNRFPDFAPAYHDLAFIYYLLEQPGEAIEATEKALLLLQVPNANYYARAGSIYEWIGDLEQALIYYRQALLIDPQNPGAQQGIGRLSK